MKIDENSHVPLYFQLRENIREKIISGEWKYADEIPSETTLCRDLNLSRTTVKQAFDGLVAEGLIIRKRGRGSYVNYKKLSYRMMEQPNFYQQMDDEGADQKSLVVDKQYISLNKSIADKLDVPTGEKVAYFKRIRNIDNVPMIIQDVYILPEYEKGLMEKDLTDISFHRYIEEKNNFILDCFDIDISAIILNQEDQHYFNVEGYVSGFHFDTIYQSKGKKIIYNERVFRGDMVNLSLNFDYRKGMNKKEFKVISEQDKF